MAGELLATGMDADHEIIRRSQNQTFAAQMNQNLGFSLRCGQKMERGVDEIGVEEGIALRPFDGTSSNLQLNTARTQGLGQISDTAMILDLVSKAISATPAK